MGFRRSRTTQAFVCTIALGAVALAACDDAVCPSGTTEQLGHCIRNSELVDAETSTTGEQAVTGSAGTSAPTPSSAGTGTSPIGAGGTPSKSSDPAIQWMCMKNVAGECTSCKQDTDCPKRVCEQDYCMDCRDSMQCSAAESCISNRCVPERKPSSIWTTSGGGQTTAIGFKLQATVGTPAPGANASASGFKLSVAPGAGNF